MRLLPYLIFLSFLTHSSAYGEAKKKPWVATKDSYKSKEAKNAARAPKSEPKTASVVKPKTNVKPKAKAAKATAKAAPKPVPPKEVVQEAELPPPLPDPVVEAPPSSVVEAATPPPAPVSTTPAPSKLSGATELKERVDDETRQYTFRIHSYLGVLIGQNSGSVYGINVAIIPESDSLWYFGAEVNFSRPSAGSIMSALAGAWRDFPIYGASRLSLGVGALLGPVFPGPGTGLASPTYAAFLNTALCKEIDELAMVRAEFRPGLVGGRFAFLMNFGVTFRFL